MSGQAVTFTFTIDQGAYALTLLLVEGAIALGFLVYALLVLTHRLAGTRLVNRWSPLDDLAAWSHGAPLTRAQYDDLLHQFTTLAGWAVLGYALGLLVALGATAALALSATGTLASLLGSGALALLILQFLGAGLGMTLGFLFGSWRATQRRPSTQTYGDLRMRRPRDYRAPWVAWGPALITLCAGAPLWLVATRATHVTLSLCGETWTYPTAPTLGVFLALGALIQVVSWLCVHWLVESPRTLLVAEPLAARGADELWRAIGIGTVLGLAWMSSGVLLQSAMSMATSSGVRSAEPGVAALLSGLYLLATGAFLVGMAVFALRGRLGGRLTGWRRPSHPYSITESWRP